MTSAAKPHTGRRVLLVALAVLALGAGAYAYLVRQPAGVFFQGWVEGDILFIAPDETGRVEKLDVFEGQEVKEGAPLFTLDSDLQRAAVAENEAAVANAKITFTRAQELLKRAVGSQKAFDDAEATLRTAEARLNSAKTRLDRRTIASPATGAIQEVYFRVGEMVPAGRPIVSLLPPANVKVRFFVPQAVLPSVQIGTRVAVQCDGCIEPIIARVRFVAAQAEFTPPVIYSQEERARLVFRIEAIPEKPETLKVGQPVSVSLQQEGATSHARR